MNSYLKYQNLLRIDGTNQLERLLPSLDPEYIRLDERNLTDLLKVTYELAQMVRYFDNNDHEDGTWQEFHDYFIDPASGQVKDLDTVNKALENRSDFNPHVALFLTFLQLFAIAQEDLNGITRRNLDYYYKEVLQLKTKEAAPDRVHLIFELAKNLEEHLIPAGTELDAGKDQEGNPLIYTTERDIVINRASIQQLKSLLLEEVSGETALYAAPVANSKDGLGAPLEGEEAKWPPFGESQQGKPVAERTMADAEIGFAVASPQLHLREGNRIIVLTFELEHVDPVTNFQLNNALDVFYSTGEGWEKVVAPLAIVETDSINTRVEISGNTIATTITTKKTRIASSGSVSGLSSGTTPGPPLVQTTISNGPVADTRRVTTTVVEESVVTEPGAGPDGVTTTEEEKKTLILILSLPADAPPVATGPDQETYGAATPMVKVLLRPGAGAYDRLKGFQLVSCTLDVQARGLTELLVQNDQTQLDPSKPFLPFGAQPSLQSNLYIGSAEVFQKKLSYLNLNLSWKDLPEDFSTHYQEELSAGDANIPAYGSVSNTDFKVDFRLLYQKEWKKDFISIQNLFTPDIPARGRSISVNSTDFVFAGNTFNYQRQPGLQELAPLHSASRFGFVRLSLVGLDSPDANFTAFGHRDFPRIYANAAIAMSRIESLDPGAGELPNEPYTPTLEALSLDYASSQPLEYSNGIDQVFALGPFGHRPVRSEELTYLLPRFSEQGYLYIGVDQLDPPRNLNLLIQVAEGSAPSSRTLSPGDITWSYLAGHQWVALHPLEILSDSTRSFQTSGIVSLSVGRTATQEHTLMPSGLYWLQASINRNPADANYLITILPQAVTAALRIEEEDAEQYAGHLSKGISPDTIKKLRTPRTAVKSIAQPYSSFNGKPQEASEAYYTRVSERLRHKNRSLTTWDYERMVLEEFPSIFKVKCLNHTREGSVVAPGHVTLIVVSNLRNKNAVNPLEPRTSVILLDRIKEFLLPYAIPSIGNQPERLSVKNPLFEQLLLDFKVAFREGLDAGYFGNLLNEELIRFLSPWAFEDGEDIIFGGKVYKSDILAFVETRDFVDYVNDFQLYHIVRQVNVEAELEIPNPESSFTGPGLGEMTLSEDFIVGQDVDVAEAVSPRSILVSHPEHRIQVLRPDEAICQGSANIGIGQMIIGVDFIVTESD